MFQRNYLLFVLLFATAFTIAQPAFVNRSGQQFILKGKPYYYIGANYWYGGFLAFGKNKKSGVERLRKELDFLQSQGITNLRLLAGVEGTGMGNGVERVRPALQTSQGIFDTTNLEGLDIVLSEMGKRNMKAVLFLSNNWEWSGGFLQYLNWNGLIDDSIVKRKLTWDEQRDYTSKFYSCSNCVNDYLKQVKIIINRTNKITNKKYADDPAIMSWELVNEPRPMRSSANEAYKKWITNTAAFIKTLDKNHLITLGHEGNMGTDGDIKLYEQIHTDKNVDYLTIHIWPKNWSWFKEQSFNEDLPAVKSKTIAYIDKHITVAKKLQKPLVIEEFGLPRDGQSFDINSTTILRDEYYNLIFSEWQKNKKNNDVIAGINFWAFGGTARPVKGQIFWKAGDDYMGDPPMEEQGLNTVFDSDKNTWNLISSFARTEIIQTNSTKFSELNLVDRKATPETKALYYNLKILSKDHTLFGHQHATQYGHGWSGDVDRSDVKSVTGSHPAVIGIDLSGFSGGTSESIQQTKDEDRKTAVATYDRGGVTTVAWHFNNPISAGGFYWKDSVSLPAVKYIIPGGSANEKYKEILRSIGEWANNVRGKDGKLVPMIFRPFHEFDGDWFWWGSSHCTREEFISLWRFTVSYLRDSVGVHNFIYAFSPDNKFTTEEKYLERYPGDAWVDMLGVDNYGDMGRDNKYDIESAIHKLEIVSNYALKTGKLAAFTETGLESIPNPNWWTDVLLKVMRSPGLQLSYVLVWRNDATSKTHFYAPFPGQVSVPDFIKFYNDPYTMFEKDLPDMYKKKNKK